jgi:hypothetical protein
MMDITNIFSGSGALASAFSTAQLEPEISGQKNQQHWSQSPVPVL